MPETDAPILGWILLALPSCLLIFVLFGQMGLRRRIQKIETQLRQGSVAREGADASSREAREGGGDDLGPVFQEFLAEDPARRELAKKEQFAEYRKWRNQRGLNWGSADGDA